MGSKARKQSEADKRRSRVSEVQDGLPASGGRGVEDAKEAQRARDTEGLSAEEVRVRPEANRQTRRLVQRCPMHGSLIRSGYDPEHLAAYLYLYELDLVASNCGLSAQDLSQDRVSGDEEGLTQLERSVEASSELREAIDAAPRTARYALRLVVANPDRNLATVARDHSGMSNAQAQRAWLRGPLLCGLEAVDGYIRDQAGGRKAA